MILAGIFCVLITLLSMTKKRVIFNDSKNDVTVTSPGHHAASLSSQSSIIAESSVSYLMTLINNDSMAVIIRNGFVFVGKEDTVLVSKLLPVSCYLENSSLIEISVSYGVFTVFVPPGTTRKLEGLILGQDKSALLTLKDFINGNFGKPEIKSILFDYQNGKMLAKFNK